MEYKNKSHVYEPEEIKALENQGRLILYYGYTILDVTDYKHPGGQQLFNENKGKDIQVLFNDQGHSKFAYSLIDSLRIGYNSTKGMQILDPETQKIHDALDKKIDLTQPILP